jgi:hypothetical protein
LELLFITVVRKIDHFHLKKSSQKYEQDAMPVTWAPAREKPLPSSNGSYSGMSRCVLAPTVAAAGTATQLSADKEQRTINSSITLLIAA